MTRKAVLRCRVEAACREFLARAPVEDSTLTLDGTGVNGHIQFLILKTLGHDVIKRLRRINLVSGSAYTYCAFLGIEEGHVADVTGRMQRWDADNRAIWHEASLATALRRALGVARGRTAFFSNECLERMLRGTASDAVADRRIADLPNNVTIWLYSQTERRLLPVTSASPFGDHTVAQLARCCAAIPRLYSPARLGGHAVIDPVFSPDYKALKKQIRTDATNHLIGNVALERATDNTIWLKPHAFGDGKWMVIEDFARMVLNVPNPRIYAAFQAAYGEAKHDAG